MEHGWVSFGAIDKQKSFTASVGDEGAKGREDCVSGQTQVCARNRETGCLVTPGHLVTLLAAHAWRH